MKKIGLFILLSFLIGILFAQDNSDKDFQFDPMSFTIKIAYGEAYGSVSFSRNTNMVFNKSLLYQIQPDTWTLLDNIKIDNTKGYIINSMFLSSDDYKALILLSDRNKYQFYIYDVNNKSLTLLFNEIFPEKSYDGIQYSYSQNHNQLLYNSLRYNRNRGSMESVPYIYAMEGDATEPNQIITENEEILSFWHTDDDNCIGGIVGGDKIKIWDTNGIELRQISVSGNIFFSDKSSNPRIIAYSDRNKKINIYAHQTESAERFIYNNTHVAVNSNIEAFLSPDKKFLVIALKSSKTIYIWDCIKQTVVNKVDKIENEASWSYPWGGCGIPSDWKNLYVFDSGR